MQITRRDEIAPRTLGEETRYDYLGDYFKAIVTRMPVGHVQKAHSHDRVIEVTYVISGAVRVTAWRDGTEHVESLGAGDLVAFPVGEPHTMEHAGPVPAELFTFKTIVPDLPLAEATEVIASDWIRKT